MPELVVRAGSSGRSGPSQRLALALGGERLGALDRFLQWDLVTVTPWGAPVVTPVGARLDPRTATVWTSTATGLSAKLRNLSACPRAAFLFARPGEPALLLRGTVRLHAGDGTATLARLFRLMGGAGGARAFYQRTVLDPAWRWLYREYWRRCLIELRAVECWTQSGRRARIHKLRRWPSPRSRGASPPAGSGMPVGPLRLDLDGRGRHLIAAGFPCVVAQLPAIGEAPVAWPVSLRPHGPGWELGALPREIAAGAPSARAGLAVHIVDDAFETAEAVGWIGKLSRRDAPGTGAPRLSFRPRRTYGFVKPPGRAVDAAAGLAMRARSWHGRTGTVAPDALVSRPDVARAARAGAGRSPEPSPWPAPVWPLLEALFLDRSAATVALGGAAALAPERLRGPLLAALDRAQRERDAAHGLLLQGGRTVSLGRVWVGLGGARVPVAVLASFRPGSDPIGAERACFDWIAARSAPAARLRRRLARELGNRLPSGHVLSGSGADAPLPGPPHPAPVAAGWGPAGRAVVATLLALGDRVRPR
ncbi:MAG TPA: pyridoxamine 5'-phosphate oxidase family protein [Verrucomicrobiae bacterium]|nr:pyridoxamine 5'-phosphate oxidase family protein [Verrucomicrobiae bacterium]